jgi:predicted ATP-grasp superfamily ATP-dependent carboligase
VERLERIIALCEEALCDPGAVEGAQLKAADVIIRAIRMGYSIVREVDVEDLERRAEEIKERLEERRRGR